MTKKKAAASAPRKRDIVLVHGVTDDRRGLNVLRYRNQQLESGTVRALEEGKPIHGEVVTLNPSPDHPLVYDVEVQHAPERADGTAPALPATVSERAQGPAQVATERYRKNWDAIWKRGAKKRDAPN